MKKETSFGIIPLRQENKQWHAFLILHSAGNYWSFPKGHNTAADRDPKEAAKRELKEETGFGVAEYLPFEPLTECYQFEREGTQIEKTVHYYPALVEGTFLKQKEEVLEGKWVPFEDVMESITFDDSRQVWRDLLRQFFGGM